MRWRRWRQDLRLWLRRRSLAVTEWTSDALSRRWVLQSLAALALLVLLSALHRSQGLAILGPTDRWLEQSITQPYDFRGAASRISASPVWKAARVPELVERLRRSLVVPTLAPGSQGPAGGTIGSDDVAGPAVPAMAPPGGSVSEADGGETGLGTTLLPPIPGAVLRVFGHPAGQGANTLFQGLELQGQAGMPVRTAAAGTVLSIQQGEPQRVTVDHGGGLRTVYVFTGPLAVRVQDRISRGSTLGTLAGQDGTQVYFEVQVDGRAVDPSPFLPEDAGAF